MAVIKPQLSQTCLQIDDFSAYAQNFIQDDTPICEIETRKQRIDGEDFSRLEVRKSLFKNCVLHNCGFDNATFTDVVFENCDLSNSSFQDAYFERCSFVSCKCAGTDMSGCVVRHTSFERLNLQYSNFNKARMTDVSFSDVDFTEACMSEAKLIRFETAMSKFVRSNFFKTPLTAVDFTDNVLLAPVLSFPPTELKGAVINPVQAADLIGLWGVIVKQ